MILKLTGRWNCNMKNDGIKVSKDSKIVLGLLSASDFCDCETQSQRLSFFHVLKIQSKLLSEQTPVNGDTDLNSRHYKFPFELSEL